MKKYALILAAAALAFYLIKRKPKVTEQQAMIAKQNSF